MNTIIIMSALYFLIMLAIIYQIYIVSDYLEDAGQELKSQNLSRAGRNLLYIIVLIVLGILVYSFFLFIYFNKQDENNFLLINRIFRQFDLNIC